MFGIKGEQYKKADLQLWLDWGSSQRFLCSTVKTHAKVKGCETVDFILVAQNECVIKGEEILDYLCES